MASKRELDFEIILASQSPRRKELLNHMNFSFRVIPSSIEEVSDKKNIEEWVIDLAFQKARDVFEQNKESFRKPMVVGSDTIVYFQGETLGKPKNREEAKRTLLKLSGNKHEVYTGVSILYLDKKDELKAYNFCEKSDVYFSKISDSFLDHYLDLGEYSDKAGSYGIQGAALPFIERIEGCYANIVGFPISRFRKVYNQIVSEETPS